MSYRLTGAGAIGKAHVCGRQTTRWTNQLARPVELPRPLLLLTLAKFFAELFFMLLLSSSDCQYPALLRPGLWRGQIRLDNKKREVRQ